MTYVLKHSLCDHVNICRQTIRSLARMERMIEKNKPYEIIRRAFQDVRSLRFVLMDLKFEKYRMRNRCNVFGKHYNGIG